MSTPETQPTASKPDRRRFQYTIAELLVLTTIVAIGLSLLRWLAIEFGIEIVPFVISASIYVGCAALLFADARKRGYSGVAVVVLFTLLGPFMAFVWIFVRPKAKIAVRPPTAYTNPDDALTAAFQLDMQGDWEAAIAHYREVARRWPKHEHYVLGCIDRIEEKRLRA